MRATITAPTRRGSETSAEAQWPRPDCSAALMTTTAVATAAAAMVPRRMGPGATAAVSPSERIQVLQLGAQVGERTTARDRRQRVEVVRRRRRRGVPLECVAAPGVVPGPSAVVRPRDRVEEKQCPGCGDDG